MAITLTMVPREQNYNTGPNQYYSSFVVGGYDNVTLDGEGIACSVQITPDNYLYSEWSCFQGTGNTAGLAYPKVKGSLAVQGGPVQGSIPVSLTGTSNPYIVVQKGFIITSGIIKFKHHDTQVFWNSSVYEGKIINAYSMRQKASISQVFAQPHQSWMYGLSDNRKLAHNINAYYGNAISLAGSEVCEEGFKSWKSTSSRKLESAGDTFQLGIFQMSVTSLFEKSNSNVF